jgi:hypothetical protein
MVKKMKINQSCLLIFVVLALSVSVAQAASNVYSTESRQINAAVLYTGSGSATWGPNPINVGGIIYNDAPLFNLFYVMDQKLDLKPSGWTFRNPLAPSTVSLDLNTAWGTTGLYQVGSSVTPAMPFYWSLSLDTASMTDLMNYDVLFLPVTNTINFYIPSLQREKLRKFVDGGGTLWIEPSLTTTATFTNFFATTALGFSTMKHGGLAFAPDPAHPLLCRPLSLSFDDATKIASFNDSYNLLAHDGTCVSDGGSGLPDTNIFSTVLSANFGNTGFPIVSAAQYGSGQIVCCSAPLSELICTPVMAGNKLPITNPAYFPLITPAYLKMAYNIVGWGSECRTFHQNSRHSGFSFDEIGNGMLPLWSYPSSSPNTINTTGLCSSPVFIDDYLIYLDNANMMYAFDVSGRRSMGKDSYGNPNPLWHRQITANKACSSLTAAYVPVGGGVAVPWVFVTSDNGKVYGIRVDLPGLNPLEVFMGLSPQMPQFAPPTGMPTLANMYNYIPAPTCCDNTLYITGNDGTLRGFDFVKNGGWTGTASGAASPNNQNAPKFSGNSNFSPVVGCVHEPTTGAVEKVLYISKEASASGGAGTGGGVDVVPLASYNEVISTDTNGMQNMTYPIMAGNNPVIQASVAARDGSGTQLPQPTWQTGNLAFSGIGAGGTIYADYATDPFSKTLTLGVRKNEINIMGGQFVTYGSVNCTPALGKNDNLYFTTDNDNLYAVQEMFLAPKTTNSGPARTRVKWRWCLRDNGPTALLSRTGTAHTIPGVSPAVAGNTVFFAVNDGANGYILAFNSDPDFYFSLGGSVAWSSCSVSQADSLSPANEPGVYPVIDQSVYVTTGVPYALMLDSQSGKLAIPNFRIEPNSPHDFSCSADMTILYLPDGATNAANQIQQVHQAFGNVNYPNDKWNNLLWCVQLQMTAGAEQITSSPMVLGNMLYVGGSKGNLYAFDVAKTTQFAEMNSSKYAPMTSAFIPWQAVQNGGAGWVHAVSPGNPICASVAGASGMLAIKNANGLLVVHNPTTLICDADRVCEIDGTGNISWSCDGTVAINSYAPTSSPVVGGAKNLSFDRPSVARYPAAGGIVVADTGNNRVVWMDKSGQILWSVANFIDTDATGPWLSQGESTHLDRPVDVQMWTVGNTGSTQFPEYHYLIADAGNNRAVEIAARYNIQNNAYENDLVWCTRTLAQGKKFSFKSAQMIYDTTLQTTDYVCAVSDYSGAGSQYGTGALVKFQAGPVSSGGGTALMYLSQIKTDTTPVATYNLLNPSFYNRTFLSGTEYQDLFIDLNGIHVADYTLTSAGTSACNGIRHYTPQNYYNPVLGQYSISASVYNGGHMLAPVHAQILNNGDVLVTNKATTVTGNGAYNGEVFELEWDSANGTNGAYDIVGWWPGGTTTYGLRQPQSAERTAY